MSHYFINDNNLKDKKRIIRATLLNQEFSFYTNEGVFSKDKVDYGTKLLLNNIDIKNIKGNVLDLGCGIGIIGIVISKTNNILVDMVDINERALSLAKENCHLNKVTNEVFVSDVYQNITKKYNFIITNPPIRAGKKVLEQILLGSKEYLEKEGILYFVMRKDHGVKSMIKKLEELFKVNIKTKDKGFYIVECILQ